MKEALDGGMAGRAVAESSASRGVKEVNVEGSVRMRGYGCLCDGGVGLLSIVLIASGESADDGDGESVSSSSSSIASRRQCARRAARLRPHEEQARGPGSWVRLGGALGASAAQGCG